MKLPKTFCKPNSLLPIITQFSHPSWLHHLHYWITLPCQYKCWQRCLCRWIRRRNWQGSWQDRRFEFFTDQHAEQPDSQHSSQGQWGNHDQRQCKGSQRRSADKCYQQAEYLEFFDWPVQHRQSNDWNAKPLNGRYCRGCRATGNRWRHGVKSRWNHL